MTDLRPVDRWWSDVPQGASGKARFLWACRRGDREPLNYRIELAPVTLEPLQEAGALDVEAGDAGELLGEAGLVEAGELLAHLVADHAPARHLLADRGHGRSIAGN